MPQSFSAASSNLRRLTLHIDAWITRLKPASYGSGIWQRSSTSSQPSSSSLLNLPTDEPNVVQTRTCANKLLWLKCFNPNHAQLLYETYIRIRIFSTTIHCFLFLSISSYHYVITQKFEIFIVLNHRRNLDILVWIVLLK